MKTTNNRIRKNSSARQSLQQAKTPAPAAARPALIPAQVVQEMEAALSELDRAASAAVAFTLMNAAVIETAIKGSAEWEQFDVPRFSVGVKELAQTTVIRFDQAFGRWSKQLHAMMDKIREHDKPVIPLPYHPENYDCIHALGDFDVVGDIENAVTALTFNVEQDGNVMGERVYEGAFFCGMAVGERLEAAFKSAWERRKPLVDAFIAVHC